MAGDDETPDESLREGLKRVLDTLTYREREVIKLRYGLGDGYTYTPEEVASIFKARPSQILEVEARAIRKLQHPSAVKLLEQTLRTTEVDSTAIEQALPHGILSQLRELEAAEDPIEAQDRIRQIRAVSVDLIKYLGDHTDDIVKLPWQTLEQLVAECLASRGFESVRLVGRESTTAADIFAIQHLPSADVRLRFFIEVKRWKDKIGVEVIDRVLGAMTSERAKWGWHVAMVVSPVGFKSFRKYTREGLRLMGVELRDKDDIVSWLQEYRPSDKGLWLPKDFAVERMDASSVRERPRYLSNE